MSIPCLLIQGSLGVPAAVPPTSIEYVLVAGGGGGGVDRSAGNSYGGAGGGGGFLTSTLAVSLNDVFTVTVGSGGSSQGNGGYSELSRSGTTVTATGGGRGGNEGLNGASGGSGGGAGGGNGAWYAAGDPTSYGGTGTGGQGYNGGNTTRQVCQEGWFFGVNCYAFQGTQGPGAAGGGAGGAASGETPGTGVSYMDGYGTGAAGAARTAGSGTQNSGNGGGNGQAGGSGVVVIRYPDAFLPLSATTGSPTITQSGGYTYYRFTGSGSFTV